MKHDLSFSRRQMLLTGLGAGAGLLPTLPGLTPANAAMDQKSFDPASRNEKLEAYVKLIGSLSKTTVYVSFGGTMWGAVPGRVPAEICGFRGLARTDWTPQEDGTFLRKLFEISYFCDLETGALLNTVVNPMTGEQVTPFHIKGGGGETLFSMDGITNLNATPDKPKSKPFDLHWTTLGHQLWLNEPGSGESPHPLSQSDWPRESSGPTFFFGGDNTMVTTLDQMRDKTVKQADFTLFWSTILPWSPWLLMGNTPGIAMWRAFGAKLHSHEDVPAQMRAYLEKEQPNFFDASDPWEGTLSYFDQYKQMRKPAPTKN